MAKTKFIFIGGGVMSGIGKGVTTSSIGKILQGKGFKVSAMKIDPYVNVDAGTMNPVEHGEVFVTADGLECDQDIGNYERFLDINLTADNYITTGRVYQSVIQRERDLGYKGKCVQVVPDIPNEAIARIRKVAKETKTDFVMIEIGGTAGEYENMLFLEAVRMMRLQSPKDVIFVLVSYLPVPPIIGEMKTKPTQHAVRALNTTGIQPDIIIGRSPLPLDEPRKEKIARFCNISKKDVISAPDIKTSIYEIPLNFEKDNLGNRILKKFGLNPKKTEKLELWKEFAQTVKTVEKPVEIGIVGKYFCTGGFILMDSYISVIEAVKHAAWFHKRKPAITWLSAETYEKDPTKLKELKKLDGIIVPGGFGSRGTEGKIKAIEFCRKNKIPYLGLCLGMQLAVAEFARNVCRLEKANSTEMDPETKHPVIDILPEQKKLMREKKYGATMRLGAYDCEIKKGTQSFDAYQKDLISERHRHRYEFNNDYLELLEKNGLVVAGVNPQRNLVEIIEIKNHPFFVGAQFHPEFQSRPIKGHPLFNAFIQAAIKK